MSGYGIGIILSDKDVFVVGKFEVFIEDVDFVEILEGCEDDVDVPELVEVFDDAFGFVLATFAIGVEMDEHCRFAVEVFGYADFGLIGLFDVEVR